MRDKLDWHEDSAVEAGQPPEHGFVHIACFLHWLARRDWLEGGTFDRSDIRRIADGSIELADLIALTDGQLAAAMATGEGRRFGDARYDAYVERWAEAFAAIAAYGVPWSAETRTLAVEILDDLYEAWVDAGRPRGADERADGLQVHERPEAEVLLPAQAAGSELEILSLVVDHERAARLAAAWIDPAGCAVVVGLHAADGRSPKAIQVTLLVAPGTAAATLEAYQRADPAQRLARAQPARFGTVDVTKGRSGGWHGARWARDGAAAFVLVRSEKRLGLVVPDVDATLDRPVELTPVQPRPAPGPLPFERPDTPHADPAVEAMLPDEVLAAPLARMSERLDGWYQQFRAPIVRAGLDPAAACIATATGAEMLARVVSVPGGSAEALAPIAEQLAEMTTAGAKRTQRQVGDRDVTWLKGRGWTGALWVRTGLVCSVVGSGDEELLLEAISLMP